MIVLSIACGILAIGLTITSYLLWASYRKLNAAIKYAEWYAGFLYVLLQKIKDVKLEMDIIDRRGAFKADDEVGHTFEALQEVITDLDAFIQKNLEID